MKTQKKIMIGIIFIMFCICLPLAFVYANESGPVVSQSADDVIAPSIPVTKVKALKKEGPLSKPVDPSVEPVKCLTPTTGPAVKDGPVASKKDAPSSKNEDPAVDLVQSPAPSSNPDGPDVPGMAGSEPSENPPAPVPAVKPTKQEVSSLVDDILCRMVDAGFGANFSEGLAYLERKDFSGFLDYQKHNPEMLGQFIHELKQILENRSMSAVLQGFVSEWLREANQLRSALLGLDSVSGGVGVGGGGPDGISGGDSGYNGDGFGGDNEAPTFASNYPVQPDISLVLDPLPPNPDQNSSEPFITTLPSFAQPDISVPDPLPPPNPNQKFQEPFITTLPSFVQPDISVPDPLLPPNPNQNFKEPSVISFSPGVPPRSVVLDPPPYRQPPSEKPEANNTPDMLIKALAKLFSPIADRVLEVTQALEAPSIVAGDARGTRPSSSDLLKDFSASAKDFILHSFNRVQTNLSNGVLSKPLETTAFASDVVSPRMSGDTGSTREKTVVELYVKSREKYLAVDSVFIGNDFLYAQKMLHPPANLHPYLKWLLYTRNLTPRMVENYMATREAISAIYAQAKAGQGNIRYRDKVYGAFLPFAETAAGNYELVKPAPAE